MAVGIAHTPIEFDRLYTSITIDNDTIYTPDIALDKEGIEFDGSGWTRFDGEAEYELNIVLSPEIQNQIPMIREKKLIPLPSFAQSDLPLQFRIKRHAGKFTGDLEARRFDIEMISNTVKFGTDIIEAVESGVKLPAKLLYEVLQYLPKPKRDSDE